MRLSEASAAAATRPGLTARLALIVVLLALETVVASYFIQLAPLGLLPPGPQLLHQLQHWLFRFMIAYAISLAMLAYLRDDVWAAASAAMAHAPLRGGWAVLHALLLLPFAYLTANLYAASPVPFAVLALAWHLCALAAALALCAAMAPLEVWKAIVRQMQGLPLYAILPAAAAVAAIRASQMLWAPTARVTFRLVRVLLEPLMPQLQSEPATLVLGTPRFAVQIAEQCSGLEGIGLLLAFCTGWLWLFRREYRFPRALLILPLGVLVIFLLNAVRIAAVALIGNAGYDRVAMLGFHSQAGWIAFNLTAFGIAVLAHRSPWMSRTAGSHAGPAANPTAAYLMPFLAILAAGMLSHAMSADFEFLYPLRLAAALVALWAYRRQYRDVQWRFTWRAPAVGAAVFVLWIAAASLLTHAAAMPAALGALPAPLGPLWIAARVLAAVVTVPLAEELAYRGYLLRRLAGPHFETVPLGSVRWPPILASALAFGVMHGAFWLPASLAGIAYGALAVRTGRLGESVAAHGTTNALLAVYVLAFGQWQLW